MSKEDGKDIQRHQKERLQDSSSIKQPPKEVKEDSERIQY